MEAMGIESKRTVAVKKSGGGVSKGGHIKKQERDNFQELYGNVFEERRRLEAEEKEKTH